MAKAKLTPNRLFWCKPVGRDEAAVGDMVSHYSIRYPMPPVYGVSLSGKRTITFRARILDVPKPPDEDITTIDPEPLFRKCREEGNVYEY